MHRSEVSTSIFPSAKTLNVALLGNPNCGKSSIFNHFTGLNQRTGNFPGVTTEKKQGRLSLDKDIQVNLIDFPGTYSLYPNSQDERVVLNTLTNPKNPDYPDLVLYIADVTSLEKHLLLFTQVRDLGLPVVLALNMTDIAERQGVSFNVDKLSRKLGVPVCAVSARTGKDMDLLKRTMADHLKGKITFKNKQPFYRLDKLESSLVGAIQQKFSDLRPYQALLWGHHFESLPFLKQEEKDYIQSAAAEHKFESLRFQVQETMNRFQVFSRIAQDSVKKKAKGQLSITDRVDNLTTHRVFGPALFIILMLLVFQAIFAWSTYPMDKIDEFFGWLQSLTLNSLPEGWLTNLLAEGIIAGIGGIVIFVPQIAILFLLISLLEEVGYMSRAVFMFDRVMQQFGLNGRSIVALVAGGACAIPAVMSTRTISNWKERLITIMVTPLISCSARIPVYAVLIGLVVPSVTILGIFNLQGLAFMSLYLLGIIFAFLSALVFKKILKSNEASFLMIEMPPYRTPSFRNVMLTVYKRTRSFVVEAGKVILVISVILWILASYGPGKSMDNARNAAVTQAQQEQLNERETENLVAARQIEASFAGHLGKFIEPAIRPLGYDWKIGIALITSFAAREVFVGTMATIYSIGNSDDPGTIRDKMAREKRPDGTPVYTLATAFSLLIFYVFAMQCMSTLAVVWRETGSWKWPAIQFLYMSILAYVGALIVYHLLS